MPILPIDSGRYGNAEMKQIFDEEERLQKLLDVEAALAWAQENVGEIPRKDAEKIEKMASTKYVKLERVKEIDKQIHHDLMAMVRTLAEACGTSGAYVHLGATSSDILDTATALQLKKALSIIEDKMTSLQRVIYEHVKRDRNTIMVARTHGQHSLPITLGFKFAVWLEEVTRHLVRLRECSQRVLVGKMSGAVGTQAGLGPNAIKIQELVMKRLGLEHPTITTQIIQRDLYAELICVLANIACSFDKFALEIRELQRSEINELSESFEKSEQVGSSTMPQKRNPILCERVCGLARIVRSLVIPALENVPLWHERDLTQSSCERFIIPEACIIVDYMTSIMIGVLKGLWINRERMRNNLDLSQGRIMSEAIMITLAKKGMNRQDAYSLVRSLIQISEEKNQSFKDTLIENRLVRNYLSLDEINRTMIPENYLGTALKQIDMVIEKLANEFGSK